MTLDAYSNLSPEFQQTADRAHFLRGKVIGCYAQIEFLLADMCSQFWESPVYLHLKSQFPSNTAARVEAATKLFLTEGPLAEYRKDVTLLAELKSFKKTATCLRMDI